MLPDVLSVSVRALSFLFALQAAGIAVFIAMFGGHIAGARGGIRRVGFWSAVTALALVLLHYGLEPARMAGELAGILDPSLQRFVAGSGAAAAAGLRVAGLALVAVSLRGAGGSASRPLAWIAAVLIALSFTATGHTSAHAHRALLAGLLAVHLVVIEIWFGALLPLILTTLWAPQAAARVVQRFSRIAVLLVPLIAIAGVALAYLLIPGLEAFREPYGQLLLAKAAGFTALLGVAAINKWKLGPDLETGTREAARRFRISVSIEYVLIVAVLGITAVMTTFFSPE